MDNGFPASTRAEMIRQARESCAKNLYAANPQLMDGAINENKEKKIQNQIRKEEKKQIVQTAESFGIIDSPVEAEQQTYAKLLAVRVICAILITLTVITVDRLNLNNSFIKKVDIEAMIASNVTMDQLEQSVSNLIKDTILPVFNGSASVTNDSEQPKELIKPKEQTESKQQTEQDKMQTEPKEQAEPKEQTQPKEQAEPKEQAKSKEQSESKEKENEKTNEEEENQKALNKQVEEENNKANHN